MRNVGQLDRLVRIIIGLALISLVFVGPQTAWGWIGVLPLITGLVGWCGLYTVLGLNTCNKS
ncbi:hypothetical protein M2323_002547 [Rhodoblastus acidophilus]|uniref:YgaP family membrane protein n=1 Tax=Rhodoblastus acidophilus TaxID=1074 RepID=UPI0016153951|nr:DUF2892 domain-containing protein [Rhodoblastus acidophilus]MCW2284660.1 hypothetical protein [Rhodoblastus acidophilus]MCW2333613.1 hypothetical protein [Rhodoblastus acidophilus]